MNERQVVALRPYLDILHRHRLAAFCVLIVGLSITGCLLLMLPDIYQSSTLILIEPQQVASAYLATQTPSDTLNRVRILSKQALSQTHLSEVIKSLNLYPLALSEHEPMDELVEYMRKHIAIDLPLQKRPVRNERLNSFTISFEYPNALLAQKVTARLADIFLNEDLRERADQANAATAFLHDQVTAAALELQKRGDEIKDYKLKYNGSLPEDLDGNVKQVEQLQAQLASAEQALQTIGLESPETQLAKAKAQLVLLRARYGSAYPDVIAQEQGIKALEAAKAAEEKSQASRTHSTVQSPLDHRVAQLRKAIDLYSQRIAVTPEHAQALAALQTNYAVLQKNYEDLLNKELDARVEAQLVERQEGERFRVLDPATLPITPAWPNRPAVAILGVVLSLLAATALPFGVYFTDTSFHDSSELERKYSLPVLASIPASAGPEGLSHRRHILVRAVAASSFAVMVAGIAIWIYANRVF